jgi:hypothetical protein
VQGQKSQGGHRFDSGPARPAAHTGRRSLAALCWSAREATRAGGEIHALLAFDSGLAWIDVGSDDEPLIVKVASAPSSSWDEKPTS